VGFTGRQLAETLASLVVQTGKSLDDEFRSASHVPCRTERFLVLPRYPAPPHPDRVLWLQPPGFPRLFCGLGDPGQSDAAIQRAMRPACVRELEIGAVRYIRGAATETDGRLLKRIPGIVLGVILYFNSYFLCWAVRPLMTIADV